MLNSAIDFFPRIAEMRGKMLTGIIVVVCVLNLVGAQLYDVPPIEHSRSPESYGIGARDDMVDWSQHPCRRECRDDGKPMICRYGITVEEYATMSKACYECPRNISDCFRPHCISADGSEKTVIVANRRIPGMTIEVCKGDRVLVDLTNALATETTTLHWHGMHQRGTTFMDGVPFVTQCPVMPGETFRYDFLADTAGTHLWHSHSGEQRADGLFGALIVRPTPKENKLVQLYDHDEHLLVLNEWTQISGHESYVMQYQNGRSTKPSAILVNGHGRNRDSKAKKMPIPVFEVEKGSRYRFRLINVGVQVCSIYVTVERHSLLAVSTDGADVEPVEVETIRLLTGERYDFVLNADQEIGSYKIWLVGGDRLCEGISTTAVLRYKGAPEVDLMDDGSFMAGYNSRILNLFDEGTETPGAICVSRLNSVEADDPVLTRSPDKQIYISYDFYEIDTDDYHRTNLYGFKQIKKSTLQQRTLQLNHITFKPPNFPLQTQPELIRSEHLCNVTRSDCTRVHCACTHVLEARLDSVVEFVIVDKGKFKMNHPMHLHGYYFRVLAMEKLNDTTTPEQVREWDLAGKIERRFEAAPKKDSLGVPSGGYAVVRIHANNPGYWFFHCHYDKHASNGMALVLKVGEHEDFPPVPKDFPKCGPRAT